MREDYIRNELDEISQFERQTSSNSDVRFRLYQANRSRGNLARTLGLRNQAILTELVRSDDQLARR